MAARTVQPNAAQTWCSLRGFLRHVQTDCLTPTCRHLSRLAARPPGEREGYETQEAAVVHLLPKVLVMSNVDTALKPFLVTVQC